MSSHDGDGGDGDTDGGGEGAADGGGGEGEADGGGGVGGGVGGGDGPSGHHLGGSDGPVHVSGALLKKTSRRSRDPRPPVRRATANTPASGSTMIWLTIPASEPLWDTAFVKSRGLNAEKGPPASNCDGDVCWNFRFHR